MKTILLSLALFLNICYASSINYQLGSEQILFEGNGSNGHLAFPHAAVDEEGIIWVVYRKAKNHVGSIGQLWLAKYHAHNMDLISNEAVFTSNYLDPRDPTITVRNGETYISFFQYNYPFNMVRQFVLKLGDEKPRLLMNKNILNTASSAPMFWHDDHWILPIYYIKNFYSMQTDVGYFIMDEDLISREFNYRTIAEGPIVNSYLLEPAIGISGDHWVTLYRTSPVNAGAGGVAIMMQSHSVDGGKTWGHPQGTPFLGHHPRITTDSTGRMWAGFRDLTHYSKPNYKAKITLWKMPEMNSTVTVFETTGPSTSNWDCGYPTWIELAPNKFRVIYYYSRNNKQYIASKLITLRN